jgi:Stress responsive A/B Barrel Domain
MFNRLLILSLHADHKEGAMSSIAALSGGLDAHSLLFAPTLPGVYNGGDAIWRASFSDRAAAQAAFASEAWEGVSRVLDDEAAVAEIEWVDFETGLEGGASDGCGLYRVALFNADRNATPERLAAFAEETASMPGHVAAIRRWQLSSDVLARGRRRWTHVWEQEYADRAALEGPYMRHPVHWAQVERWFDPEYPEWLVNPFLVHSFCATEQSVI